MDLRFPYIDMHCDTLMKGFFGKKEDVYEVPEFMFDFDRFGKGDGLVQFTAVFFPPRDENHAHYKGEMPDDIAYFEGCRDVLLRTIEAHSDKVSQVKTMADYKSGKLTGKNMAMLTLEDGRAVNGSMDTLKWFYDQGVRTIALTWNFANCFGFPNSTDKIEMDRGLTAWGKEAVCAMEEMGMIVDCSHLSDGGFYDLADILKKPFLATHSNCRSLVGHPRNMTDDMIRVLGNKGGVMGLNFCPRFVCEGENPVSRAELLADHAAYAANLGGVDIVGVGTDLDGIGGDVEIDSPDKMELLWEALSKKGFHESEIEKIAYKNVERVMTEVLK